MENNNSGKGIFYGVIGIATLIVAIIGATFAYFTATARSEEGAINITSYEGFNVTLSMNKTAPNNAVNKLIPLKDELLVSNALTPNTSFENQLCIDNNGDQVCTVYQMTLRNSGAATSLVGYLTAETNEYCTAEYTACNLKYQLFTKDESDNYTAVSDSVSAPKVGDAPVNFVINSVEEIAMDADDNPDDEVYVEKTYYLVIWLHDTGVAQNDDIGKTFLGKVTFNATSGGSTGKLEATFGS